MVAVAGVAMRAPHTRRRRIGRVKIKEKEKVRTRARGVEVRPSWGTHRMPQVISCASPGISEQALALAFRRDRCALRGARTLARLAYPHRTLARTIVEGREAQLWMPLLLELCWEPPNRRVSRSIQRRRRTSLIRLAYRKRLVYNFFTFWMACFFPPPFVQ